MSGTDEWAESPLTPAHLLARALDNIADFNKTLGKIETQMNTRLTSIESRLTVHENTHSIWSKVHRFAYTGLFSIVGTLSGLLAAHWH